MLWTDAWDKIENTVDRMSDIEKAKLAAQVLNEVDPKEENIKTFFDECDDHVHNELISRAEDRETR